MRKQLICLSSITRAVFFARINIAEAEPYKYFIMSLLNVSSAQMSTFKAVLGNKAVRSRCFIRQSREETVSERQSRKLYRPTENMQYIDEGKMSLSSIYSY